MSIYDEIRQAAFFDKLASLGVELKTEQQATEVVKAANALCSHTKSASEADEEAYETALELLQQHPGILQAAVEEEAQ